MIMAFRLLGIYSDGMIAAADKPFTVRAFGEEDTATFTLTGACGVETLSAKNIGGVFTVTFSSKKASYDEYVLTASCGNSQITVDGIAFGEVYLAIGQSNMCYTLDSVERSDEVLSRAKACKNVKLFDIFEPKFGAEGENRPYLPQRELRVDAKWLSGDALRNVSALSVMTATLVAEQKNIPVGVIHASVGGLSLDTYIPRDVFEQYPEEVAFQKKVGRYSDQTNWNQCGVRNFTQLSGMYNEKIAPITCYAINAILWHQGENSAWDYEFGAHYKTQLGILIDSYRRFFGEVPFVSVQIACHYYPYGDRYGYHYVNEAMLDACLQRKDCFCVPIYDIQPRWNLGDGRDFYHPIHPVNKYPVSQRMAQCLLLGKQLSPYISAALTKENKAIVTVAGGSGLKVGDCYYGFTLADANGKYYQATATAIAKDAIEVFSPSVKTATAVTYAFCQYQENCNCKDVDGNPLFSYRKERLAVDDRYFFLPPYLTTKIQTVTENCFGTEIGTSRTLPTWDCGKIYSSRPQISYVTDEGTPALKISAAKEDTNYHFFGISPNVCLSGHHHHLANYRYLELQLRADAKVDFRGIVVRLASGETRRFGIEENGESKPDAPIAAQYQTYAVLLGEWLSVYCEHEEARKEERSQICEIEFYFRAKTDARVWMRNLRLCDEVRANHYDRSAVVVQAERSDTKLPT